jgi:hypothetical protein
VRFIQTSSQSQSLQKRWKANLQLKVNRKTKRASLRRFLEMSKKWHNGVSSSGTHKSINLIVKVTDPSFQILNLRFKIANQILFLTLSKQFNDRPGLPSCESKASYACSQGCQHFLITIGSTKGWNPSVKGKVA